MTNLFELLSSQDLLNKVNFFQRYDDEGYPVEEEYDEYSGDEEDDDLYEDDLDEEEEEEEEEEEFE